MSTEVDRVLRPAATFRVALAVVAAVFAVLLFRSVGDGWPATLANGIAFAVTAGLALLVATSRVWVEPGATMYDPPVLHAAHLGRHRRAALRSPHRVRIDGAAPDGPRPSWRLTVSDAGGATLLTVRSPWAPDLHALVMLLRRWTSTDPGVVADDTTRELLRYPPRKRSR